MVEVVFRTLEPAKEVIRQMSDVPLPGEIVSVGIWEDTGPRKVWLREWYADTPEVSVRVYLTEPMSENKADKVIGLWSTYPTTNKETK